MSARVVWGVVLGLGAVAAIWLSWSAFERSLIPAALNGTVLRVEWEPETDLRSQRLILQDGTEIVVDRSVGRSVEEQLQGSTSGVRMEKPGWSRSLTVGSRVVGVRPSQEWWATVVLAAGLLILTGVLGFPSARTRNAPSSGRGP